MRRKVDKRRRKAGGRARREAEKEAGRPAKREAMVKTAVAVERSENVKRKRR